MTRDHLPLGDLPLGDLRWTTRAEVCDRLVSYLTSNPVVPGQREPDEQARGIALQSASSQPRAVRRLRPYPQESALRVLARLADPCHAAPLVSVATQPDVYARVTFAEAVNALHRLQVVLPPSQLSLLSGLVQHFDFPDLLRRYFLLFRSKLLPEPLRESLESPTAPLGALPTRVAASLRGRLLARLLLDSEAPPAWIDWLYQRWASEDRATLATESPEAVEYIEGRAVPLNVVIAARSAARPASQELLADYRLRPSEEAHQYVRRAGTPLWPLGWETLPPELWGSVAELVQAIDANPERFAARAQELDLPYDALLRYTDAESLLNRVELEFRRVAPADQRDFTPLLWRCLQLLQRWPDERADFSLKALYADSGSSRYLSRLLWAILWQRGWERSPEAMRATVRAWSEKPVGLTYMGQALLRLAECPRPEDREFFLWAVARTEKPEFRYQAVRALESLGEAGARWIEQLHALLDDPDATVRVAAAGTLLRLGERSRLDILAEAATREADSYARADALRYLGEVDPGAFIPQFTAVLMKAAVSVFSHTRPGVQLADAHEAAFQLASLGSSEALTALLQGYLAAENGHLAGWWLEYLAAAARRQKGEPEALLPRHRPSRLQRPWEWRCCGNP